MLREPAACGRRFLDHKVSRGRQLWPAPLAGDDGSKSCFPVERHQCASQLATLNPRDHASRHCCPISDVLLAPAAAPTKGLRASAEADRIHRAKRMTA